MKWLPILIVIVAVLTNCWTDDNRESDLKEYCEMVALWEANKNTPEEDRPGWPPYKGVEQCK